MIILKETSSFNHIIYAFTRPNIFSKKLRQLWLLLRHLWLQSRQLWFLRHKSKAAAAVNKKKICYSSLVVVEVYMYMNDCCPWASQSAVKLQCQTKDSSLVKQIERCLYQGELLACFTTHSCSNHFQLVLSRFFIWFVLLRLWFWHRFSRFWYFDLPPSISDNPLSRFQFSISHFWYFQF